MNALAAVRNLVEAARSVVERRGDLAPALVLSTGLSPEGVELALTRHLELEPTDEDLERLLSQASRPPARSIAVVLSANVFVGALRAIAFARASAPHVRVRPSRRDPAFARALVARAADPGIVLEETLEIAAVDEGEIHVYGRDATIAAIAARARVPLRGHGAGMGLALVTAASDLAVAARDLAEDVVPFDQRGCLSPRIAVVEGGEARALELAEHLHRDLDRLSTTVPRGAATPEERAEATRYLSTMACTGRLFESTGHAIGVAPPGTPLLVPPAYRHLHIVSAASMNEAVELVRPLCAWLTAVGSDEPPTARRFVEALGARARVSALGAMQRPPLDGPVDLRSW